MKLFLWIKRLAIALLLLALFSCVLGPWALYWAGLSGVDGKPELSTYNATEVERQAIWKKARGIGEPAIVSITPYEYFFLGSAKNVNSDSKASVLIAWRIASNYNLNHLKHKGMFWWHFSGAALTIWLTRNWTTEQLFSKVAEAEHDKAG